jgi:hypothetical protein
MPTTKHISTLKYRGNGLKNLLEYIHNPEKTNEKESDELHGRKSGSGHVGSEVALVLGEGNIGTKDIEEKVRILQRHFEINNITGGKERLQTEAVHMVIAYSPDDSKTQDTMQLVRHTEATLKKMAHQKDENGKALLKDPDDALMYTYGMHQDKSHKHSHVVVSRYSMKGQVVDTQAIQGRFLKPASDELANSMGINVVSEKEHQAISTKKNSEYKAQEDGRPLNITEVRERVMKVLRENPGRNIIEFKYNLKGATPKIRLHGLSPQQAFKELNKEMVVLKRQGIDGNLLYKYRDNYIKASNIGAIAQLAGLKEVQRSGFYNAIKTIEQNTEPIKILNYLVATGPEKNIYLSLINVLPEDGQEEESRRHLDVLLMFIREQARDLSEYHSMCRYHGIEVIERTDGKYEYKFDNRVYQSENIGKEYSIQELKTLLAKAESGRLEKARESIDIESFPEEEQREQAQTDTEREKKMPFVLKK